MKKIITRKRLDKVRGAIVGAAIGDALGMPAEGFSPKSIKKFYGKINNFVDPNPEKSFHKLKAGQWTDDTQLTLAIGESIIEKGFIDYENIAEKHINIYKNGPRGWGGSTKRSMERLLSGHNWWNSGEPNGAGNGPPMKISPIGVLYGNISDYDITTAIINISKMTHLDIRPAIASIIQAKIIGIALNKTPRDVKFYLRNSYKEAQNMEQIFGTEGDRISDAIKNAFMMKNFAPLVLRKKVGAGCFVNQSFPLMLVMVYKYCFNSRLCLRKIVNLGGDADTTGSMAGAIVGAINGLSSFPKEWVEKLEDSERLIELADGLWRMTI